MSSPADTISALLRLHRLYILSLSDLRTLTTATTQVRDTLFPLTSTASELRASLTWNQEAHDALSPSVSMATANRIRSFDERMESVERLVDAMSEGIGEAPWEEMPRRREEALEFQRRWEEEELEYVCVVCYSYAFRREVLICLRGGSGLRSPSIVSSLSRVWKQHRKCKC